MVPKLMKVSKPDSASFAVNRYVHEDRFPGIWHFHDEYELTLILESSGTRMVGDHIDAFAEGDLVFIGKNLPHTWRNGEVRNYHRAEALVLHFLGNMWGPDFFGIPEMERVNALLERSHRGVKIIGQTRAKLAELLLDMENARGIDRITMLLSLLNLLSMSEELVDLSSEVFANSIDEPDAGRLQQVYEYIMNNFQSDIGLVEVAKIAHMSPSAFSRYFKSRMRKPFRQFVIEQKIGYACKLLMGEGVSVTEACYESGFQNLSNFNEQFKKITGMAPKRYQLVHANK